MSDINNNETDEMDIEMIDITYEDGTSCTCEIIAKFEVNDISYAALLPADDEDADIIVYRYSEQGDDVTLDEITDEVDEDSRCIYFKQAENGMYVRLTPSTRSWTIWNSIQMTRNNIRTSMRFL